jgi:WhiB family transcriptional regulator, redox-sensing transcriptional regulator
MTIHNEDWRGKANCTGVMPELFNSRSLEFDELAAKKVCGACAVRGACLDYAIDVPERTRDSEIWGGLNGEERSRLVTETAPQ